jgi:hypothetical protein
MALSMAQCLWLKNEIKIDETKVREAIKELGKKIVSVPVYIL